MLYSAMGASYFLASIYALICVVAGPFPGAWAVPVSSERAGDLSLRALDSGAPRLVKRFDDARFSFYDAGLGACGKVNSNSDFIVALNAAQWAGGAHCGESITISYGGKSARAQIMDLCPGCPFGGLDMTRGLFSFFASQDLGIIHGAWSFGGSGGASPATSSRPTSTASPTTRPHTSTTYSTTTTTTTTTHSTTYTPTTTTTHTPTTTRTSSHHDQPTSSNVLVGGPTTATPTPPTNPEDAVLKELNIIFLKFAELIVNLAKLKANADEKAAT
ncbi:hypothetical protein D9611_004230 [Ephemerocybe angulata]|uniref:Uncharacterized protein n=1 Tax=Ephemerocybe angulata TaxID=980116 RepID=A0A8H5BK76_9AGAR|nr:hypothetical protein D9611_004230 [Tulosesus angulatus]